MTQVFAAFDETPLAAASIAQVHTARLVDGKEVVVKVLRPDMREVIQRDLEVLYALAGLATAYWSESRRLRPLEVVREYEKTVLDELDLMREAANAAQLKRNFAGSNLLYVPEVYWDYCRVDVMVMEHIHGVPISDMATPPRGRHGHPKLAENGVEIFFTQVFRHNFFHADMHPGNIFVLIEDPANPRYAAIDFGIVGTLDPRDQHYLAENFLAVFDRDYRRVAVLHVESGWVPPDTRIDEMESAVRTVCEPIFDKPLKDISFGTILLRLFEISRRFNMEVQPQLILLQKTLLNIEGLGRDLYPDLDIWQHREPDPARLDAGAHQRAQCARGAALAVAGADRGRAHLAAVDQAHHAARAERDAAAQVDPTELECDAQHRSGARTGAAIRFRRLGCSWAGSCGSRSRRRRYGPGRADGRRCAVGLPRDASADAGNRAAAAVAVAHGRIPRRVASRAFPCNATLPHRGVDQPRPAAVRAADPASATSCSR